jgi:hypothetical protein
MQAPTLQFMDIPDVSEDGFEGHFKVAYAGNGSITLQTKVQVPRAMWCGVACVWRA